MRKPKLTGVLLVLCLLASVAACGSRLGAEERDRAVVAGLAQRQRGAGAALAGADDQHAGHAQISIRTSSSSTLTL